MHNQLPSADFVIVRLGWSYTPHGDVPAVKRLTRGESSLLCTQTNEVDHDLLRYRTSRRTWDTRFEFFFKQRPVRIASTNLPFPQSTRRFRLKIDFYAFAITLFVPDYSSRLRGALHRRASSWRQRRGKGAAALVAEVFLDEVF